MGSLREVDKGWKRITKILRAAASTKSYVKVGFVGTKSDAPHDKSGVTNLELALIHEYGAPGANIPARPFLGPSMDKNREKYTQELAKGAAKVFSGSETMERLLGKIGAQAASDVKAFVTQGASIPPPLKPATIAAKGSDRALVDTGRMIGAVSWEVSSGADE